MTKQHLGCARYGDRFERETEAERRSPWMLTQRRTGRRRVTYILKYQITPRNKNLFRPSLRTHSIRIQALFLTATLECFLGCSRIGTALSFALKLSKH